MIQKTCLDVQENPGTVENADQNTTFCAYPHPRDIENCG